MPKIDNRIQILPDIEMYGGNSDKWMIRLCNENGARYKYSDLTDKSCQFTLIIKDYGFVHRPDGSEGFSMTKTGTLGTDSDNMSAVAIFTFVPNDTISIYGKFVFQIEMVCVGAHQLAQGNLFIRKNLN